MSGREITDRSTPAEIAEAADQLRRAQQEFQQWWREAEQDPNRPVIPNTAITVITAEEIEQQQRRIANQFDYVRFGDFGSTTTDGADRITVQGSSDQRFFVPGLGSIVTFPFNTLRAPSNSLDAELAAEVGDPVQLPNDPSANPSPPPDIQSYRSDNLDENFPTVGVLGDPAQPTVGSSDRDLDTLGETVTVPQPTATVGDRDFDTTDSGVLVPQPSSENPVVGEFANTDDSGAVDGTGTDSGFSAADTSTETETGGSTVDPSRTDTVPGEGTASGVSDREFVDDSAPVVGDSGEVDVSEFAKPPRSGSGSSIESNRPGVQLRPNVLHNYTNWTYSVALYMLTPRQHSSIVQNGTVTSPETELTNLLIRSGGTGSRGVLGDKRDYYIENLSFTSIIGQSSQSTRSSNSFDISFEIVEPYGVALLAELVQLALSEEIEDHFDVPYLLELKFRGFNDDGTIVPQIPGSGPKYIPIRIVNLTFRITSAGTIYTVTAVPYAHSPLQDQHDAFIQDNISIEGETFNELMNSLFSHLNRNEESIAQQQSRTQDRYFFTVHDEDLKNSRVGFEHITDGDVINVETQTMEDTGKRREYIQINANSTLKSAIQAIAGATDFGARFNTVGQPESEEGNDNRPLRLLKVIPVVTAIREYNTSTNRYARDIVYRIETQKMYGFVLPDMPGAPATQRGWEKEYNWIFTGKNQDIMDFEAEYNVQYYNIRTVFTEARGRVRGTPSSPGNPLPDDGETRTNAKGVYSTSIRASSSPRSDSVQNTYRGAAHQLASDHMDNVLNNPSADMMAVNLTIIGDPDWIPQDRSVLPRLNASSGDARIVNGSLATDAHDVLVMLKFKTPRDYDPEKGLMRIETDHTFVQGLYRVITVRSEFVEGKFQQQLRMIRVQNQNSNDSRNTPDLTDSEDDGAASDTGAQEREPIQFNPDGSITPPTGAGTAARPGPIRRDPRVVVRDDTRPAVQQLADPDGDGNADDPEAQIFMDPSVARPRPPNTIEDLGSDPEFTFDEFGGP